MRMHCAGRSRVMPRALCTSVGPRYRGFELHMELLVVPASAHRGLPVHAPVPSSALPLLRPPEGPTSGSRLLLPCTCCSTLRIAMSRLVSSR